MPEPLQRRVAAFAATLMRQNPGISPVDAIEAAIRTLDPSPGRQIVVEVAAGRMIARERFHQPKP